jgi:hypothetical protein
MKDYLDAEMKKFRENLKAQTPFVACAERLDLPMKSGNQYEITIKRLV